MEHRASMRKGTRIPRISRMYIISQLPRSYVALKNTTNPDKFKKRRIRPSDNGTRRETARFSRKILRVWAYSLSFFAWARSPHAPRISLRRMLSTPVGDHGGIACAAGSFFLPFFFAACPISMYCIFGYGKITDIGTFSFR